MKLHVKAWAGTLVAIKSIIRNNLSSRPANQQDLVTAQVVVHLHWERH